MVIGRGDTETASFATPSLTSVSCAARAAARAVMGLLRALPATGPARPGAVEVRPRLTVRASSAPAPQAPWARIRSSATFSWVCAIRKQRKKCAPG